MRPCRQSAAPDPRPGRSKGPASTAGPAASVEGTTSLFGGAQVLSQWAPGSSPALGFLFDILNNSEGGEEQALLRGVLLILYNGLEGLDLESDEMKFLLNFEDFRLERVKEIRSELENLIGDGLKKENRTSKVIMDW